jgi:hypothetical protein
MKSTEQQLAAAITPSTGGTPWQFRLLMIVIAGGFLMLAAKVLGLF